MSRHKTPQITNDDAIVPFTNKNHKRQNLKIGDKVRLKHPMDKRYVNGTIQNIFGWDVYVKMKYKGILVHCYPNEVIKV